MKTFSGRIQPSFRQLRRWRAVMLTAVGIAAFSSPNLIFAAPFEDEDISLAMKNILAAKVEDRIAALKKLQKKPKQAEAAIDQLVEALEDFRQLRTGEVVSQEAARVLAAIGTASHAEVLELLRSRDTKKYVAAAACVKEMKPNFPDGAVDELLRGIDSDDKNRLWVSLHVLSEFGTATAAKIDRLIEIITYSPDPPDPGYFKIHTGAIDLLGENGPGAARAVPTLLDVLKNGITSERTHAATALGKIGIVEGQDVPSALLTSANDIRSAVRESALEALGRLGPLANDTAPGIEKLLLNVDFHNRCEAAAAYALVGGNLDLALEVLSDLIDSPYDLQAMEAYRAMGPKAEKAAPRILKCLQHRSPDIRIEAALALEVVAPNSADVRSAIKAMAKQDKDADAKRIAGKILKRLTK